MLDLQKIMNNTLSKIEKEGTIEELFEKHIVKALDSIYVMEVINEVFE